MKRISMQAKKKENLVLDHNQKGIWKFSLFLKALDNSYKLTLKEGLTREVKFNEIFLKREDENPTGSLKDRGMAYLISYACSLGEKNFVLSSSGNAAISASEYCRLANLKLIVFVSEKIEKEKMKKLKELKTEIICSKRPISDCFKFSKKNNYYNLRPSSNKFGSEGYQTIAFEIIMEHKIVDDIFIPVSSGVCLIGMAKGFERFGILPRIHLCQSSAVCPLAKKFDSSFVKEEESLAKALVARTTPLGNEIEKIVRKSRGTGWVIENLQINQAQKTLLDNGIETSAEGALALAGIKKAKKAGWNLGKTVCLLTGRQRN